MSLLELKKVSKEGEDGFTLDNISFRQERFQKIAIAGETGSGKSTLLKIIAGLVQPDQGVVLFEGQPVAGPDEKLVPGHPSIAYLSQHFELQRFLRVEQVLSYANHIDEDAADNLFRLCQIDHLLKRKTDQLSGGERQRIALARLLVGFPRLLILDEPFSNLDLIHKNTLKEVIGKIGDELKISVILVSHDPQDTLPWADQLIVMRGGKVVQQGSPQEIYGFPADEYVAGLFGKYSLTRDLAVELSELFNSFSGWMVRPENWIISPPGEGAEAEITDVHFFGHYYEIEFTMNEKKYFMISLHPKEKGTRIFVSIRKPSP